MFALNPGFRNVARRRTLDLRWRAHEGPAARPAVS